VKHKSKATLDASIAISRNEQRAWIGVKSLEIDPGIEVGNAPTTSIIIENSGRSPAIGMRSDFNLTQVCGTAFPKRPFYDSRMASLSSALLLPGATTPTIHNQFLKTITEQESGRYRSGDCVLYVHARITYMDIFRRAHWRHFCVSWDTRHPKGWVGCSFYNDGDEDYTDGKEPD
jgi:hypothetical protein